MDIYQHRRQRLLELIDQEHRGERVKFCDRTGLSESRLAQLLSPTYREGRAFSEKTARKVEALAKLPAMYFDQGAAPSEPDRPAERITTNLITATHPDDATPTDVILVPESRIEFSGGSGRVATYELIEDQEPATYRLSWFQKYGINPDKVRRFRVAGRSMEPMLYPRDTILVNTDETDIIDGKLYAIRYENELRVKYLFRRLGGTLILRSVNPDYKDEEVSPEMAQEHISIIGRVRDTSGTGGL